MVVEFKWSYLNQDKTFTHRNLANLFIVCQLDIWSSDLNTKFVLGDCLFEAMKLTKSGDLINIDVAVMVLNLMHIQIFQ